MAINFTKPVLTDNYSTGVLQAIRDHQIALGRLLDTSLESPTGVTTGIKRYNATTQLFESWTGSAWATMPLAYLPLSGGTLTGVQTTNVNVNNIVYNSLNNANAGGGAGLRVNSGGTIDAIFVAPSGGAALLGTTTNHALQLWTNNTSRMNIAANGAVTVSAPSGVATAFAVQGYGPSSWVSYFAGTTGYVNISDGGGVALNATGTLQFLSLQLSNNAGGGVGIQIESNNATEGAVRTTTNHPLAFYTNNVQRGTFAASGGLWLYGGEGGSYGNVSNALNIQGGGPGITFTNTANSNLRLSLACLSGTGTRELYMSKSDGTWSGQHRFNVDNGNYSTNGSGTFGGLVYGRGGGAGLGQITVSTSAPSGGADGDLWLRY